MFSDKGEETHRREIGDRRYTGEIGDRRHTEGGPGPNELSCVTCVAVQGGAWGRSSHVMIPGIRATQTRQQTSHKTNTKFLFNLMSNEGCCAANP